MLPGAYTISARYILLTGLAVLFSWFIHELAHYVAGTIMGYNMAMTLNTAYPVNGQYSNERQYQLVSAAGPIITIVEAIFVFIAMQKRKRVYLFPFLFTCFYMRLLAGMLSFLNLNDEARISKAVGLGTFTLPLLVIALLSYLLFKISKQYGFSKKFNLSTLGIIIFISSIIVLTNQYFKIRIF